MKQGLTEVRHPRVAVLNFIGNTKDRGDADEGRGHDLAVESSLTKVPCSLGPHDLLPRLLRMIRTLS